MDTRAFIEILNFAERLKDATRHCYTSGGRKESVAEHCWRAALMAYLMRDEFPQADMNKVIQMCIIHDMGEAITGDIPVFDKTEADEEREEQLLYRWVDSLPQPYAAEMRALYEEMDALSTLEARIFKAIDGLEAVVQHNECDIRTWEPNEYELNLNYGYERVEFSPYMKQLRDMLRSDTQSKIESGAD